MPVELAWDAPAECPTQADVLAELQRITRVNPGRVVTPIRARAQIEHTGARYRLHLRTEREDQTGDTDLDASDCGVLKRGVTLVLALALGDGVDVMDENTPTEPAPAPPPPAPPPPRPAQRPAPKSTQEIAPKPAETASLRVVPALSGVVANGFLGSAAFGVEPSLALGTTHFVAFAELALWPLQTATHIQGVAAKLDAASGALAACVREPLADIALSGCARATLGAIHARSEGAFHDGSSTAPYSALGPALVLEAPLALALKLRLEAALDVSLAQPSFDERNFGTIYRVSRVLPSLSLGLAFAPGR